VYLPAGADWYHYWTRTPIAGGQTVTVPAEWGRPPLFVRAGHVLPVNIAEQHFAKYSDERGFEAFPALDGGSFDGEFFDDDGVSFAYRRGGGAQWSVRATLNGLRLSAVRDPGPDDPGRVTLILPGTDQRAIACEGGSVVSDGVVEGRRFVVFSLQRK
jgi:alpha-glucosidase